MRQLFLAKIIALFIVLIASTSVIADGGTHFIVLIDDNKDFKDHINQIEKTLPAVLFDGIQKKQSVGTAIPIYRPNIDHLSLVFFGLTKSPTCIMSDPLSIIKPYSLFHWGEPVPTDLNKENFRKFLSNSLKKDCLFTSDFSQSPIFTAEFLILPFVQTKLSKELFFSRTVLLLLSNDYDEQRARIQEIDADDEQSARIREIDSLVNVQNKSEVTQVTNRLADKFHLERPVEGIFTVHMEDSETFWAGGRLDNKDKLKKSYPLVYRMTEFKPKISEPVKLSDYRQEIKLDRLAVSDQELQIVPVGGDDAALLRLPTFDNLHPVEVSLQFVDSEENIWQLGKHEFPQYKILVLDDCNVCTKQADDIHIPLFKVIAPEFSLAPDDEPLERGTLDFTIIFRYKTGGVYDHAVYDTPWRKIEIVPSQPLTIPADIFFPAIVLDNQELAKQWTTNDTMGLRQEEALKRIQAGRDFWRPLYFLAIVILFIVFVGIPLLWLYGRYSKYPFKPVLQWTPAETIELNFNQLAKNVLLPVGTLTVDNEGTVFQMIRSLKEPSQPSSFAKLSLSYKALNESGLRLNDTPTPLGFKKGESKDDDTTIRFKLVGEIKQTVSHETSIELFLATQAITDFEPASEITTNKPFSLPMEASVTMEWKEAKQPSKKISAEIEFNIQLVPEEAAPPQVSYHQRSDQENCCFNLGQDVWVGTLRFESGALHHFATPFQGNCNVQVFRDNVSISPQSIVIEGDNQITILPYQKLEKAVSIRCNGEEVPNPDLYENSDSSIPFQEYVLSVNGQFALGSHSFRLYRDLTLIDIQLDIIQFDNTHRIVWINDRQPCLQQTGAPLEDNILKLRTFQKNFDGSMLPTPLFKIQIGKNGRGSVEVTLTKLELECPIESDSIQFLEGFQEAELFRLFDENDVPITPTIEVKDGDELKSCVVKLNTHIIDNIVGSRIDNVTVVVEIEIEMIDDSGKSIDRHLTLRNPIVLEKLPHPNWLCIDFGTSAITAAIGNKNHIRLLPLQKITSEQNPHINLADYDPDNEEKNRNLLPSYVLCDADLRQTEDGTEPSANPGFPNYRVTELPRPGNAHFLGLPAVRSRRQEYPGRIIFSLKSWLSQLSLHDLILPEEVTFQLDQRTVTRKQLPLEDTVKSGFAALAEAYLLAFKDFQVGQAIICHPNSFSYWHKNRLRKVATEALSQRLKIDLPDKRIELISESEAVAYCYCRQRIEQSTEPPPESEHLLIYDFGAGTVDLSLIRVEWNKETNYPKSWQVKNTFGVPIAGNYLDSILARLIDESLRDGNVLKPELFDYQFPVVSDDFVEGEKDNHSKAIYNLWMAIRETKQQDNADTIPAWGKAENPFCVNIGNPKQGDGIVKEVKPGDSTNDLKELTAAPTSERCLRFHEGDIYLCIPEKEVHDYPPMRDFIEFITNTVISELLNGAQEINETEVNTVVIAGRGALWPGLRDKIWNKFPNADKRDDFIRDSKKAKEAVVRGAIAWQQLRWDQIDTQSSPIPPLGILLDDNRILKTEDEWQNGIDLTYSEMFSLVQLSLKVPDPRSDFKSLRQYFYTFINEFHRDSLCGNKPTLIARSEEQNGTKRVIFENDRHEVIDLMAAGVIGQALPPWPIGEILLPPEKDEEHGKEE